MPQPSLDPPRAYGALPLLLIAGAVLLVFAGTLRSGFIWTDEVVYQHPVMASSQGLWRIWADWAQLQGKAVGLGPVALSAFWLEGRFFLAAAPGYHAVNIAVHAGNAALLWVVLRRLRLAPAPALTAALLFALHPLASEAVAWVAQLKTMLPLSFCLASFLAYLRAEEEGCINSFAASVLLYSAALLASDAALGWPLFLLCYLVLTPRLRAHQTRWRGWSWLPFAAVAVLAAVSQGLAPAPLLAVVWAFWASLLKVLWPLRLGLVYQAPVLALASWTAYLPAFGLLAVVTCLVAARRLAGGAVVLAAGYYAALLLGRLGLRSNADLGFGPTADHWQYLALPGAAVLAALALWQMASRYPRLAVLATCGLLTLMGGLTATGNARFASPEALWTDTLTKNPDAWLGHHNFAMLCDRRGDAVAAEQHYRRALALNRSVRQVWYNLALLESRRGRLAAAVADYREAVRLSPAYVEARINLAATLAMAGRYREAAEEGAESVRLAPLSSVAQVNLARTLEATSDLAGAVAHLQAASQLTPLDARLHAQLAAVLVKAGRLGEASSEVTAALCRDPGEPLASSLSLALRQKRGTFTWRQR